MVVLSISAGAVHSLIIRGDGKVLGTGISNRGQLGLRENYPSSWKFIDSVDSVHTYTSISAGSSHSLLLTANGEVTMATTRARTPKEKKDQTFNRFLQPIRELPKVISFSAGYNFSLFIIETKQVWCMGYNEYGQLGTGDTEPSRNAIEMGYNDAKQVSAGSSHSLVLDEIEGTIYACGRNNNGALGLGKSRDCFLELEEIKGLPFMHAISAGWNHSLFLSRDGEVFGCGSGFYGELGNATPITQRTPAKIEGLPKIKAISAGHSHSVFLSEEGEVWECGKIIDKQYLSEKFGVRKVEGLPKIKSISAGFNYFSLYLDEDGYAWGRGLNPCDNIGVSGRTKKSNIFVPEPELIAERVGYTKNELVTFKQKKVKVDPFKQKVVDYA